MYYAKARPRSRDTHVARRRWTAIKYSLPSSRSRSYPNVSVSRWHLSQRECLSISKVGAAASCDDRTAWAGLVRRGGHRSNAASCCRTGGSRYRYERCWRCLPRRLYLFLSHRCGKILGRSTSILLALPPPTRSNTSVTKQVYQLLPTSPRFKLARVSRTGVESGR